jgi:ribonuclease VapC
MILDSSAILAVLFREPGFETLVSKIAAADAVAIGAPTLVETGLVLTARIGAEAEGLLVRLLDAWNAAVVPFGADHWRAAIDAYGRFGRGRHRAQLNFGDCLAYAVARLADQPLLAVGPEFGKTDLRVA